MLAVGIFLLAPPAQSNLVQALQDTNSIQNTNAPTTR